jgi:hypothetical protein
VRGRDVAWTVFGAVLAAGGLTVVLQWLAGGSVGAGRLAEVGAQPWLTGALVAAEVGGGVAVVLTAAWLRVRYGTPRSGDAAS